MVRGTRESGIAICKEIRGEPWKSCNARHAKTPVQPVKSTHWKFFRVDEKPISDLRRPMLADMAVRQLRQDAA